MDQAAYVRFLAKALWHGSTLVGRWCLRHFSWMTTHDPKSVGRLARRRFSGALMSDTKWRKLMAAVAQHHDVIDSVSVKFVDTEDVKTIRFPPSLSSPHAYMDTIEFGPVELRSIEWIDFPADISSALSGVGHFVLERRGDQTRVQGYVL